jgi:hypothetical protein
MKAYLVWHVFGSDWTVEERELKKIFVSKISAEAYVWKNANVVKEGINKPNGRLEIEDWQVD